MNNQDIKPSVAIIMGSQSDWETMKFSEEILIKLNIPFTTKIISAHRTPDRMYDFAKNARENSIQVVIAGAGGAAHLPGMVASHTELPVIGVPIQSSSLNGKSFPAGAHNNMPTLTPSAPYFSISSIGSGEFPRDLLIFLPSLSLTKPVKYTFLNGNSFLYS